MNLVEIYLERDNVFWARHNIYVHDFVRQHATLWQPTNQQEVVLRDKYQYKLAICGRAVGKTDMIVIDSMGNAIKNPNTKCLIIAPNNGGAGHIEMLILERLENSPELRSTLLRRDNDAVYFTNGSKIMIYSANSNRLNYYSNYDYVYVDETFLIRDIYRYIREIIRRNPRAKIFMAGTLGVNVTRDEIDERFHVYQLSSLDSSRDIPNIEELGLTMTQERYRREVLAQF